MPLYDYQCDNCGASVEITKPMRECHRTELCACGATLRRVFTLPLVFWPGRAIGERDGWFWHVFPKMESVRQEDKKWGGIG